MLRQRMYWAAIVSLGFTAACVEPDRHQVVADPSDVVPDTDPVAGPPACPTPPIEQWTGTATRTQESYPDNVAAVVTWQRVGTEGCVDRYVPVGRARYSFAIPGALCSQSIAPREHDIDTGDGRLTIDRATTPPTYVGRGATTWALTFTCTYSDGSSETSEIQGGDVWLDAAGTVAAGRIEGETYLEDGSSCGQGHAGTQCTYVWAFDAVAP